MKYVRHSVYSVSLRLEGSVNDVAEFEARQVKSHSSIAGHSESAQGIDLVQQGADKLLGGVLPRGVTRWPDEEPQRFLHLDRSKFNSCPFSIPKQT